MKKFTLAGLLTMGFIFVVSSAVRAADGVAGAPASAQAVPDVQVQVKETPAMKPGSTQATTKATTRAAPEAAAEAANDGRDPASTDQVFTPEYQERVNGAQQASDEQGRQDRARHEKLIDIFMRH